MLKEQLKEYENVMEGNEYGGLLLFNNNAKEFISISYGDGSNSCSDEFDDYLYIRIDRFENGIWNEDVDGGLMTLKIGYNWNGDYNICQHIEDALEFIGMCVDDMIILQDFTH